MTNAEKFLKDGVDKRELFEKMCLVFYDGGYSDFDVLKLEKFFNEQVKPTLTEDERVILRNINNMCKTIYREKYTGHIRTTLYCPQPDGLCGEELRCFDNLFQFIKERRRTFD